MTLDDGNYGIVLIMGNAGFMSSTKLQKIIYHTSHSFGHFREFLHCETLNPRHLNPKPETLPPRYSRVCLISPLSQQ